MGNSVSKNLFIAGTRGVGKTKLLREVTLSFELPSTIVPGFGRGVHTAEISFSGRNLWTHTNYTGMDPEVSNFGNQPIGRNIDVAPFPPSRSFWFSLNLGF